MTALKTLLMSAISKACITLFICSSFALSSAQADNATLWNALKQGDHFVLIRHALAPGFGDPGAVDLNDCSTQRNLSEEGRQQARNIGNMFRANGILDATVLTSQWCRCRETAELLNFGEVSDMTALNSFFQRRQNEAGQLKDFEDWLSTVDLSRPAILVTHQVVITSLTDYSPSSGEIVFIQRTAPNTLRVIGTIDTL